MTPDEYCADVCGAKCCVHPATRRNCPNLADDKRCRIYAERFKPGAPSLQIVGHFTYRGKWHDFKCMRINDLIDAGFLPLDVAGGCIYAHPEILEKINGTETPS